MKIEGPRLQVREIVNSLCFLWNMGVTRCGHRNDDFWILGGVGERSEFSTTGFLSIQGVRHARFSTQFGQLFDFQAYFASCSPSANDTAVVACCQVRPLWIASQMFASSHFPKYERCGCWWVLAPLHIIEVRRSELFMTHTIY